MLWILLGVGVGLLLITWTSPAPVDALITDVSHAAAAYTHAAVRALGLGHDPRLATVAAAVAAVAAPGVVCLFAAEVLKASRSARNALSTLLVGGAAGAFLVIPGEQAMPLLICAVLAAMAMCTLRGVFLLAPTAALFTVLTSRLVADFHAPHGRVAATTALLGANVPGGRLWTLVLAVVTLGPLVAAGRLVLRHR